MRIPPYFSYSLILMVTLMVPRLFAQDTAGTLDSTYGNAGVGLATFAGQTVEIFAMEVQADGCTLLAGQTIAGAGTPRMLVSRLLPTGQLDTSFGLNGHVTAAAIGIAFTVRALALQADGKIIVAGDMANTYYVLRITSAGILDPTFAITSFRRLVPSRLTGVAIRSNGGLVVSGNLQRSGFTDLDAEIYGITSTGSVDSSFATAGRFVYGDTGDQTITCLRAQRDGKVVYAGSADSGRVAYIGRLTTEGAMDATFYNTNGRAVFSTSNITNTQQGVRAMTLDADENILVATTRPNPEAEMALLRFTSGGVMDPFFSTDGFIHLTMGDSSWAPAAVMEQGDGRIILAAHQPSSASTSQIRLRRFEWNGEVDPSFGSEGQVTLSVGSGGNLLAGIREVADGKLILGTSSVSSTSRTPTALRLLRGAAAPSTDFTLTSSPQAQAVDVGATLTLSVGVAPLPGPARVYSWYRNNSLVARTNSPSLSLTPAQAFHEGNYHVEITARGLQSQTSQPFQITVLQPPVLTNPPPSQSFSFVNESLSLRHLFTGRVPATYQWYLNDQPLGEKMASSSGYLSILVTAGSTPEVRTYHLVVSNADGEARSGDFQVTVATDPYLYPHADVLRALDEPFFIAPQIASRQDRLITWKLNGKTLPVANTTARYDVTSARLTDGGTYSFSLKTIRGTATLPIRVGVVDVRARFHVAAPGRKFQIALPTAGPDLSYSWTKDGDPLLPSTGLSGLDSPTLTINKPGPTDAGDYVCTVHLGTQQLTSGIQKVSFATSKPTLLPFTLDPGLIGASYSAQLTLPALADRFVIKGLPLGLTYDVVTHTITGIPTKSGLYPLTVTAANALGASAAVKVSLEIPPLVTGLHGRFYGTSEGEYHQALLDVLVTRDARYTGKIHVFSHKGRVSSKSFSGQLTNGIEKGFSSDEYHGNNLITLGDGWHQNGRSELHIVVRNRGIRGGLEIPVRIGESETVAPLGVSASLCPYTSKNPLGAAYLGIFNFGFGSEEGSESRPGGRGYARCTITSAGLATQVGKLADGTAFTTSVPVTVNAYISGLLPLYRNFGSMNYGYTVMPGTQGPDYLNASVLGGFSWKKTASSYTGQKNYPVEINTGVSLSECGKYLKPNHASGLTGPIMMNMNPGDENLVIQMLDQFSLGTLGISPSTRFDSNLESNPLGFKTLKFSPATGLFSGSAQTRIAEEIYDPKTGTNRTQVRYRPITVQGLVIRDPNSLRSYAWGFALLPEVFTRPDNGKPIKLNRSHTVEIYSPF